jgi:hypothetical protein
MGARMIAIDMDRLAREYANDRSAVRKCAAVHGVGVDYVYSKMHQAGIKIRKGGDAKIGTQAREKNPKWKGGTTRRKDGYVLEYVNGKQLFQHRLVAERMLGRELREGECVHHKNGNRSDNRPENIEVFPSHSIHMRHHSDPQEMSARGRRGCVIRWARHRAAKERQP